MPPGFWTGVDVDRAPWASALRAGVRAVVQPALVEDQPRRLLAALGSGVSVVTTGAAGLPAHPLLRTVPYGDAAALTAALADVPA